jgi:hypothetical protein
MVVAGELRTTVEEEGEERWTTAGEVVEEHRKKGEVEVGMQLVEGAVEQEAPPLEGEGERTSVQTVRNTTSRRRTRNLL